jgi:hypothetical protein
MRQFHPLSTLTLRVQCAGQCQQDEAPEQGISAWKPAGQVGVDSCTEFISKSSFSKMNKERRMSYCRSSITLGLVIQGRTCFVCGADKTHYASKGQQPPTQQMPVKPHQFVRSLLQATSPL